MSHNLKVDVYRMSRQIDHKLDNKDSKTQDNLAKWQATMDPLAPLTEEQMDLVYELGDSISNLYDKPDETAKESGEALAESSLPIIRKMQDFIKWMVAIEKDIKHENLRKYENYFSLISEYQTNCEVLFTHSDSALKSLNNLKKNYEDVTDKTNYLHDLSEQLMAHQKVLKEKRSNLHERLQYFTNFGKCQEDIERLTNKLNSKECVEILNKIDDSIGYLNEHLNYKESRIYKMKYESLLNNVLNRIYDYINNILIETTKQVIDPEFRAQTVSQTTTASDSLMDSAFSLYYGKFQSISSKLRYILSSIEEREERNEQYRNIISDCQKTYFTQRLPILGVAVSKALIDIKEKHRTDHTVLFRSCSLFTMKVCQDEAVCFSYFFSKISDQLNDYLGSLCQHLYDTLRPNLISINHIEVNF